MRCIFKIHRRFLLLRVLTFIIIVFSLVINPGASDAGKAPAKKDDVLNAFVTANIKWDFVENGRQKVGHLSVSFTGKLKNESETAGLKQYVPEGMMNAFYNYQHNEIDLNPPRGCPNLAIEESGEGGAPIASVKIAGGSPLTIGSFLLQVFTGDVGKVNMLQFTRKSNAKTIMNLSKEPPSDNYVFSFGLPFEIKKKKRSSDCTHYEIDNEDNKRMFGIGVPFAELKQGRMQGSYAWETKSISPKSLSIEIRDIRGDITYKPAIFPGPVSCQAKWSFGEVRTVEIHWNTKNLGWRNVTDDKQTVIVGEKVELKANVNPTEKDPKGGDWTIPGKFNKDWMVVGEIGKVWNHEKDELKEPEITFHWWKGGDSLVVKYTTTVDGKKVEAQTTFTVKKPNIPMKAVKSHGQFDVADVTTQTPKGPKSDIELYYVTPGDVITFTRDPITDFPGKTIYTQIVQENVRYESIDASLTPCLTIQKEGLDGEYPYPSKDDGITATDNPGAPVAMSYNLNISVTYDYTMYLMYRPDKEEAIYVPLKKIEWHWHGFAQRRGVADNFSFNGSDVGPEAPQIQEADEYPKWEVIVKKDDPLSPCTKSTKKK
jgi:hypothetical protein